MFIVLGFFCRLLQNQGDFLTDSPYNVEVWAVKNKTNKNNLNIGQSFLKLLLCCVIGPQAE